jgi:sulfite exporter TauE/SafE
MCGAACAGLGQAAGDRKNRAIFAFQGGRVMGYSALGAVSAASMQGLGWLTVQSAALRPLWSLLHVAALALGLFLLVRAQQPLWFETGGRKLWQYARSRGATSAQLPWVLGMLWALLPCGLLYSAVMVAALAGSVAGGALLMALFALGTSVTMAIGPWLWLHLQAWRGPAGVHTGQTAPVVFVFPRAALHAVSGRSSPGDGTWGVRLAGAALAGSSGWALWMGLVHNAAPWCVAA